MLRSYLRTFRIRFVCFPISFSGTFSSSNFFSANIFAPSPSSSSSMSSKSITLFAAPVPPWACWPSSSPSITSRPSLSPSRSRIFYCLFPSGLMVSTQPSSASFSNSSALSAWNFCKSAILFSHGTPLVTRNCLSGGRFLFVSFGPAPCHLNNNDD